MTLLHTFTSVNNVLINWSQSLVFLFVNYLAVALGRGYLVIKCHCHSVSSKLEVLDLHSMHSLCGMTSQQIHSYI